MTYVFAGGCFWCLDAVYRKTRGVQTSVCGYAGGTAADASYNRVSSGSTDHAEAVEITFDESAIEPRIILDIFFTIHDPTTRNRQGADVGPQYRSAMFYADDTQKDEFISAIERAREVWDKPIVTEVIPLQEFFPAEPEHQNYFENNPSSGYCLAVISPKLLKARATYKAYF